MYALGSDFLNQQQQYLTHALGLASALELCYFRAITKLIDVLFIRHLTVLFFSLLEKNIKSLFIPPCFPPPLPSRSIGRVNSN